MSSNPKLGKSLGVMGAYLHVFDPGSRVSMFGVNYQYTSTNSTIAAAFARTSFGADHHRIVSLSARWGATFLAGVAGLYGASGAFSASNGLSPTVGAGVQFVIRPVQRMLVNLEYAQGVEDNRGVLLRFGYDW